MKAILARLDRLEALSRKRRRRMVIITAHDVADAQQQMREHQAAANEDELIAFLCLTGRPLTGKYCAMTIASLERRLAKLETKSHGDAAAFYLIWTPPGSDRVAPVAAAVTSGACKLDDPAFCFPWPYDDMMPPPRWTTVHKISQAEVTAIGDHQLAQYQKGLAAGLYPEPDPNARCPDNIVYMNDRELTAALLGLYIENYAEYRQREQNR